jgi:hypothetical protein
MPSWASTRSACDRLITNINLNFGDKMVSDLIITPSSNGYAILVFATRAEGQVAVKNNKKSE